MPLIDISDGESKHCKSFTNIQSDGLNTWLQSCRERLVTSTENEVHYKAGSCPVTGHIQEFAKRKLSFL